MLTSLVELKKRLTELRDYVDKGDWHAVTPYLEEIKWLFGSDEPSCKTSSRGERRTTQRIDAFGLSDDAKETLVDLGFQLHMQHREQSLLSLDTLLKS